MAKAKVKVVAADVYTVPVPRNFVPPKVVPATEKTSAETGFVSADVFYSFRGFTQALTYWMPTGLNRSVATARSLRQIVR